MSYFGVSKPMKAEYGPNLSNQCAPYDLKTSSKDQMSYLNFRYINPISIRGGEQITAPTLVLSHLKKSRDYAPEDLRDAKEKMKMHCQPITSCNNLQAYA